MRLNARTQSQFQVQSKVAPTIDSKMYKYLPSTTNTNTRKREKREKKRRMTKLCIALTQYKSFQKKKAKPKDISCTHPENVKKYAKKKQ